MPIKLAEMPLQVLPATCLSSSFFMLFFASSDICFGSGIDMPGGGGMRSPTLRRVPVFFTAS